MKHYLGPILQDLTITEDALIKGTVAGNLKISEGCVVIMFGAVGGNLTLGTGSQLKLHGEVRGHLFNQGGKVRITNLELPQVIAPLDGLQSALEHVRKTWGAAQQRPCRV